MLLSRPEPVFWYSASRIYHCSGVLGVCVLLAWVKCDHRHPLPEPAKKLSKILWTVHLDVYSY